MANLNDTMKALERLSERHLPARFHLKQIRTINQEEQKFPTPLGDKAVKKSGKAIAPSPLPVVEKVESVESVRETLARLDKKGIPVAAQIGRPSKKPADASLPRVVPDKILPAKPREAPDEKELNYPGANEALKAAQKLGSTRLINLVSRAMAEELYSPDKIDLFDVELPLAGDELELNLKLDKHKFPEGSEDEVMRHFATVSQFLNQAYTAQKKASSTPR